VRRPYESGRHSVMELTPALPHSVVQWRGWPHRGSWRNNAGRDSQACQRRGVDSSLTWVPASVRALNTTIGGVGMGAASP
jgi:hypothetical protein